MEGVIGINENKYRVDLSSPMDISIPLIPNELGVNCFYAPMPETNPVIAGDFVGSVERGGPVNFLNLKINPHGNGTHTETVGHISSKSYPIRDCLKDFHHFALLVSVYPTLRENGDKVIERETLLDVLGEHQNSHFTALIIRTLPNEEDKCYRNYSGSNPVYFDKFAVQCIVDHGFDHLVTDLPSIDKEDDGGVLDAHKVFWQYPINPRENCTITELVFVGNQIKDGEYLLEIQTAPFYLDVSPSRPVLYKLDKLL